ncbi:Chromosome partition protein Smc [Thalassocella blandensis]|nr:Chromosome partition protein Smc [Thalassocella blandensis]
MDAVDLISAPVFAGLILGMILTASFVTNIFQYILYKKDLRLAREKLQNVSKDENYIQEEISRTRTRIESLEGNKQNKATVNVLNFRLAYLNIERNYAKNQAGKPNSWDFIAENLKKLLNVFLAKQAANNGAEAVNTHVDSHTENEDYSKNIESRIAELKTKIQFIDGNKNSEQCARSLRLLNDFLEKYKHSISNKQTIDNHLKKMESAVSGFERTDVQQYIQNSNKADNFIDVSQDNLDQLNAMLVEKNRIISHLEKKIKDTRAADKQSDLSSDSSNLNFLVSQVERYKHQNAELKTSIDSLKERIELYKSEKYQSDNALKNKILAGGISETEVERHTQDLHKISDEMVNSTQQDVAHLKSLLNRQRDSILKLDESLDKARSELNEARLSLKDKDETIEKLRKSSKESDICITTLEKTLMDLNKADPLQHDDNTQTLEKLNEELKKVKSELDKITASNEINEDIVMYLYEALEANSLEDLTALYYQKLLELHSDPSIELVFNEKVVSISKKGKMDKKDRILLENMSVNETNISSDDKSIRYRTKYLKGVVRSDGNHQKFKSAQKKIIGVSKVTDKIIEKIGYTQLHVSSKRKIEEFKGSIKQIAYDIDKNIEFSHARHKSIMALGFGEVNEAVDNALAKEPTSASRFANNQSNAMKKHISEIREKAIKEMESSESLRVKTRGLFLTLMKSLEKDTNS